MRRASPDMPAEQDYPAAPSVAHYLLPLALAFAAIVTAVKTSAVLPSRITDYDFSLYYTHALALRAHVDPYAADVGSFGSKLGLRVGGMTHAVDTPTLLLLFEPMTLVRPATGFWLWFWLDFAMLLASIAMMLWRARDLSPWMLWTAALLILIYPPVLENFLRSQTQVLVLLLLMAAYLRAERGDDATAGILVAIAGCLRIYPFAVMGYFLMRRKWNALVAAAITTATITVATASILGQRIYLTYFIGLSYTMTYTYACASFSAFMGRLLADRVGIRLVVASADVIVLALAARVTMKSDSPRIFPLWVVTAIVLSPIVWIHYFVLMLVPFADIFFDFCRGHANRTAALFALMSYLAITAIFAIEGRSSGRTALSDSLLFNGQFVVMLLGYVAAYLAVRGIQTGGVEPQDRPPSFAEPSAKLS